MCTSKLNKIYYTQIPASLIKLCHPELMVEDGMETYKEHIVNFTRENHVTQYNQSTADVAATKKSLLIDIVMDDIHETIAMRRTIGTDAEGDPMAFEDETLIRSVSNTIVNDYNFFDKHDVGIDNDDTIFLNGNGELAFINFNYIDHSRSITESQGSPCYLSAHHHSSLALPRSIAV